jgi:hypothetical protein
MENCRSLAKPILDWYGIWASHRKSEPDGAVWSQDPPQGVRITLEAAEKSPIFFLKERSWEKEANLHINTVLCENGLYRLWYGVAKVADPAKRYVCYAESGDGFSWERPELGLVAYSGSTRNNILCAGETHHLGAIFVDPSAPQEERYKGIAPKGRYYRNGRLDPSLDAQKFKELLVAMDLGDISPEERARTIEVRQAVHASVSPDGIHWRNLDAPILDVGRSALDTHNICSFDPHEGKYVAYLRGHLERRRLIRRAEGEEFRCLGTPRPCLMCEPQDPVDDDVYNPCYCPYPDRPLHLMFPSIYHRIASTVDIHLAMSRDGYIWSRPERRPIIDLRHEDGEYGAAYASPNLVVSDGATWRLPYVVHRRRHDFLERGARYPEDGEFRWASWQEDRLAGLEAPTEGCVTLVQRRCLGREMHLNFRTARDGWVKVELVHPPSTPPRKVEAFPGFGFDEAEKLTGDELSRTVRWNGQSDLSCLKDQEVSVRIHLYRAKIFSTTL